MTKLALPTILVLAVGWLVGCTSSAPTAPANVLLVPESYDGPAEEPSSFVSKPIMVEGRRSDPPHHRLVTPPMRAEAILEYVVNEQGTVVACRIVETNHPAYAESLRTWLSRARFVPGNKAGHPVAVRVRESFFVDASLSSDRSPSQSLR